jgi:pectate lyase
MAVLRDCLYRAKKSDKANTDTRPNPPNWSTWEVHAGVTTGWKNYPLVIYIKGVLDGSQNDSGTSMTMADYTAGDPLCGTDTGAACQQTLIQAKVERGNISIIGIPGDSGEPPTLNGGWLMIRGQSNVIVRNLRIVNATDYWPSLESCATGVTDQDYCAWNAEPDGMTLDNTSRAWVDHCEFTDGPDFNGVNPDKAKYKMYDGLLDIKNSSDYVTLSYNKFYNHNKAMLIGATDSIETGYNITFVHNLITYVQQRMPRVRNGQVHVLNNYYVGPQKTDFTQEYYFTYALGLGFNSKIYSERNNFEISGATANTLLNVNFDSWAQYFTDVGSWLLGTPVDLNAAAATVINARNASQAGNLTFLGAVSWNPAANYSYVADMTADAVKEKVLASAGVGKVAPEPSL